MKVGLVVASLVFVAGSATACSNSASTEEFCGGYQDFTDALLEIDSDDPQEYIEALKEAAEDFGDVGVPDDMSGDAQAGLELILDAIADLDDDATLEELSALEDEFSEEEQDNSAAFESYLEKTCPDISLGEDGAE